MNDLESVYEKKNVAGEWLKNHILDLAYIAVLIVYIARTIATIGVADKTVLEIIADGALAFVFAVSTAEMMKRKGILNGEQQVNYISTLLEYGNVIKQITPFVDGLDEFCRKKNEKHLKEAVTAILREGGLTYEQFENGLDNPTDEQKNTLKKAAAVKIHAWTTRELVSELRNKRDDYDFGLTDSDYLKKIGVTNTITTVLTAFIFGYFTLKIVDSFNWATLVWACVQVVFFIVKGALSYANAFMFKTHDARNRIIYKTNVLYEFYNVCNKENTKSTEEKENV